MVGYRRNRIPGGTYFFTVTLKDRKSKYLVEHIDLLRLAFSQVKMNLNYNIDAIVILPDHLYAIWTLPVNDDQYPRRWHAIKSKFTRLLLQHGITNNVKDCPIHRFIDTLIET